MRESEKSYYELFLTGLMGGVVVIILLLVSVGVIRRLIEWTFGS